MKINILFFIIPYILHIITTFFLINRAKLNNYIEEKPLRDIIHEHSPDLSSNEYRYLDNLFLIFLIPFFKKGGLIAFIHFLKALSVICFIRSISSSITDLPSSNVNCKYFQNFDSISTYITGHCFDKIFSGHTAATLLLIFSANKFNLISDQSLIYWIILQIIYTYVGLICTRHHYSVDIFISYIITPLLYNLIKNYL